jgi:hypothetical protein
MEEDLRILIVEPLIGSCSNFKLELRLLKIKMTSNGRQPHNSKSRIVQQLFIGSYSNLNLSLYEQTLLYKFLK